MFFLSEESSRAGFIHPFHCTLEESEIPTISDFKEKKVEHILKIHSKLK